MNQQKGLRSAEIETFYRGRTGFLETERPQKNSVFIENPSKYWKPKPILKKKQDICLQVTSRESEISGC